MVGVLSPLVYLVAGSPWVLAVTAVTDALMTCGLDMVWTMCLMDAVVMALAIVLISAAIRAAAAHPTDARERAFAPALAVAAD